MATDTGGSWLPATLLLGDLPQEPGDQRAYEVPPPNIAGGKPNQVLVYSFITVHEVDPGFQRGYYTISTETLDGGKKYTYYMNVASAAGTVLNSGNFWLPYGDGIKPYVYVELVNAGGAGSPASIKSKGKKQADGVEGQVFVTGYNLVPAGLPPK